MENPSDPQTVATILDGPLKYFHEELQDMPVQSIDDSEKNQILSLESQNKGAHQQDRKKLAELVVLFNAFLLVRKLTRICK
jgi:hypothetical protein